MTELIILGLFLFVVAVLTYGMNSVPYKNRHIVSQLQMMGVVNLIMICIFAFMSNLFIQANPNMANTYILVLILGTIFVSILSVSTTAYTNLDLEYKGNRLGMTTDSYWLNVFFPFLLVLLGFFFYMLFISPLPEVQFISSQSLYKAVRSLDKNNASR